MSPLNPPKARVSRPVIFPMHGGALIHVVLVVDLITDGEQSGNASDRPSTQRRQSKRRARLEWLRGGSWGMLGETGGSSIGFEHQDPETEYSTEVSRMHRLHLTYLRHPVFPVL